MTPLPLAPDVAWDPEGHLSEVALSVAADGEYSLFDSAMHEHLAACETCTLSLGAVALRSAAVAEALSLRPALSTAQAVSEQPSLAAGPAPVIALTAPGDTAEPAGPRPARDSASPPVRRRVPRALVAAALAVAALGALPSILTVPARVEQAWGVIVKVAPSMIRIAPHAAHRAWAGESASRIVIMWVVTLVFLAMGLTIARRASKKMAVNGGDR